MYTKVTKDIRVTVTPFFLEDETVPEEMRYVWAYHIIIENQSNERVKLLTRKWIITDSTGTVREVLGEGVVGEQPDLDPGESYEYTSGVPLATPSGFMQGIYVMISEFGETFEVEIPCFSLDSPFQDVVLQ